MKIEDPLTQSILAAAAEKYAAGTPLGDMARSLLSGDVSLRQARQMSWFTTALQDEYIASRLREKDLPDDAHAEILRSARGLAERFAGSADEENGRGSEVR